MIDVAKTGELLHIPKKTMFLYGETRIDWTTEDVLDWIDRHSSDQAIADMMAQVHNHVGNLGHEYSEDDCDDETFESWSAVEEKLREIIFEREGISLIKGVGWHYQVAPYMEAHGYRDGSGLWVSKGDEGYPASVFVCIDDYPARREHILGLFSGCEIIEHRSDEKEYGYLESGVAEFEIKLPGSVEECWMEMPDDYGEITLGIGDWHSHYDCYEHDFQCLEWNIVSYLNSKTSNVTLYSGDEILGSMIYQNPEQKSFNQLLGIMHLPPESKQKIKSDGARFEIKYADSDRDYVLVRDPE